MPVDLLPPPDASSVAVPPAYLWVPPRVGSYGDEAIDLARLAGLDPDPEQCLGIDAMLSYGPGGRWVALESCIIEARQNGKTTGELEPVVLFDLFLLPPDRIIWTAHLFKTARDAFADFCRMVEATPMLSRRVKKITYANGEEAIALHSGAKLEFHARSKGGGRGLGGKRLVFDEALVLSAESMGALIPTLSARDDPQINYGSSAARPESTQLKSLVARGRAGDDPSLIYKEYKAPGGWSDPGCDLGQECPHTLDVAGCSLDNEELWARANHAIGRRISYEFVRGERRSLAAAPREFGRERLGWDEDEPNADLGRIPQSRWDACGDPDSAPVGDVVFAVDMSPGGAWAAIAVAGRRADGKAHVGIIDYHRGTEWVPARLAELQLKHEMLTGIVWQPGAPIGALAVPFKLKGIRLLPMSTAEFGQACGAFRNDVLDGSVRHQDTDVLNDAFRSAERRIGVEGVWTWGRRVSAGDICPLVAATEALWGLSTAGDGEPSVYEF